MAAGAHRASRAVVLVPAWDAALPADSELCQCPVRALLLLPYPDRRLRLCLAGRWARRCQLLCPPLLIPERMGAMDVLLDRHSRTPRHRGAPEHGCRYQEREVHKAIPVLGLP